MSLRRLPNGRWEARPTVGGRRMSRSFDTRRDAELWAKAQVTDFERGDWTDPKLGKTKLKVWANRWLDTRSHVQPGTLRRYRDAIGHLGPLGDRPLSRVQKIHVEQWVGDLAGKGLAAATIGGHLTVVRSVLRSAVENGMIAKNPAEGVRGPKQQQREMTFVTPAEIDRLDAVLGEPYGLAVSFLGFTGARWSEMAGLRVRDLDLLRGEVRIVRQQHRDSTKSYKARTVPLADGLWERLRTHVEGKGADELVFLSPEGLPLRKRNFHRAFVSAKKKAKVDPSLRVHDLRHSCASNLIAVGVDVKTVGEWLGHSASYITDRYVHTTPDRLREAARKLEAMRAVEVESGTADVRDLR